VYLQLPDEFAVAPGEADCIEVAASHAWSTQWMFLGNSDAIATASQHQQAGKSKDNGYLLQREGDCGLELSVNCAAGMRDNFRRLLHEHELQVHVLACCI